MLVETQLQIEMNVPLQVGFLYPNSVEFLMFFLACKHLPSDLSFSQMLPIIQQQTNPLNCNCHSKSIIILGYFSHIDTQLIEIPETFLAKNLLYQKRLESGRPSLGQTIKFHPRFWKIPSTCGNSKAPAQNERKSKRCISTSLSFSLGIASRYTESNPIKKNGTNSIYQQYQYGACKFQILNVFTFIISM